MSNLLLTALLANSEGIDEVAERTGLEETLLERGVNAYDDLSLREQTILDNAVSDYVNVELDNENPALSQEINQLAETLDIALSFIDEGQQGYFETLVANEQITAEQVETFGLICATLPTDITGNMFEIVNKHPESAQEFVDAYYSDDGDLYGDDSEYWEVFREYYDD